MPGPLTVTLAPPPGLDSDNTSFAATGRWIDGSNVRPHDGGMQTIGKFRAAITLPGDQFVCSMLRATRSAAGTYTVIATTDKLWSSVGDTSNTDITPVGWTGGTSYMASYGDTVIVAPINSKLYQYTLGGGVGVSLGAAPVPQRVHAMLVARRQVLVFACNEELSGTFNQRCIRGSDFENPTNWTTTSTNNAFEDILDDPSGIVAAAQVGDYIAVWTSTSLWMGTYVGDPSQIYRWDRVSTEAGISAPLSFCVGGSSVYWLGPNKVFWTWAPGSPPVEIPCPLYNDFRTNCTAEDVSAVMVWVREFSEVWLFYSDKRDIDGDNTRYVAFNQQGQWFKGAMPRSAVASISSGFYASRNNVIYQQESTPDIGGDALPWFLTFADQYLSEGRERVQIQRWVPDFGGQTDDISLTLYLRDRPQSAAVTKGPYTVAVGATKKDFRCSGMIAAGKLSGTIIAPNDDDAGIVRIGKQTFDCVAGGGR